jgi:hypothetical protein
MLKATADFTWLSEGDIVLLKPALNSPDPYPATTHPLAVSTAADLLARHGAKVIIGDQSGIEHVLHHKAGVIRGSSKGNYIASGMGSPSDTRFVSFEDGGWDEGFSRYRSVRTPSWPDGFYLTSWVKKADHIISLPRVSAHSQAGATLGLKCMVGLLREDSRMEFHANGPYNSFITRAAKGSTLISRNDGSRKFFEKIVEISDAVRQKFRMSLFVATELQVTFGPDRYALRVGRWGLGRSYVVRPDPGLVFGSTDPVAADAFALAFLKDLKKSSPRIPQFAERVLLSGNRNVRDLINMSVLQHTYIRHARKIGLGDLPSGLICTDVPQQIQERLNQHLL